MRQVTLSQLGNMEVLDIEGALPFELTTEAGDVLGVVKVADIAMPTVRTKCPNCGMVYDAQKPDDKLSFFSIRHPREEVPLPVVKQKPEVIPAGLYWCLKCQTLHRATSKIGTRHIKLQ